MIGRIFTCCLLATLSLEMVAQDTDQTFMGRLRQVQQYLDNKARAKVDSHYIEVPEKPWRVILRYKENAVDVDYENSFADTNSGLSLDWELCFNPPLAASVGFWVGYRGTGFSFSKSIARNAGRYFSFSSTGAKYGVTCRLRRFSTDKTTLKATEYKNGQTVLEEEHDGQMYAPVWIRSVYVNGYYVFNGRRYSQAAAYNQSVIQRRSAGSFLASATLYQSSFDYSDSENATLILLSNNIGRIKLQQASIGIGYGYNLVPFRGMVINAMAMPSVSLYSRVKSYKYDLNYDLSSAVGQADDYGQWNPQTRTWANGKTHKPFPEDETADWLNDVDSWYAGSETKYGALRLSLDLRLGIAYNWRNAFIALQTQLHAFSYKQGDCRVSIIDAYAQTSLGVRL